MAELLMFCLKLFPSLICFDDADGGWKGGCPFVHIAFALGLFGLNCFVEVFRWGRDFDVAWVRFFHGRLWLLG